MIGTLGRTSFGIFANQLSKSCGRSATAIRTTNRFFSSCNRKSSTVGAAVGVLAKSMVVCGAALATYNLSVKGDTLIAAAEGNCCAVAHQSGLPIFTREEVAKHNDSTTGVWVTYKDDVFDVTEYVEQHPGGNRILLAAGGPIDGFWNLYKQHHTDQVISILMKHKIGKLDPNDVVIIDESDPYAQDPQRSTMLRVHKRQPFNAETAVSLIPDHFLTPNELFYVRHHHPVPKIDAKDFKLQIESNNGKSISVSIDDLKMMFPQVEATITLQCAGNRRKKYDQHGNTQGLKWDVGAISTAQWRGVWLSDVLEAIGYKKETAEHVQFTGYDAPYDGSIPFHKAVASDGDVLLAWEMNGEPIPREHGAPLRVVVPGHLAARSVKWVTKIRVSDEEAYSPWQRGFAYKSMGHQDSFQGLDALSLPSVQEVPVQSAICVTEDVIYDEDTTSHVAGYAFSGGGRAINRVVRWFDSQHSVSADGGETWTEAELKEGADQPRHRAWAWTLWEAEVQLPAEKGDKVIFCVKAVDASCNQQPKACKDTWNLRGILNNSWHHVTVPVERDNA